VSSKNKVKLIEIIFLSLQALLEQLLSNGTSENIILQQKILHSAIHLKKVLRGVGQGGQTAVGTRITVLETSRSTLKPLDSAGLAPRLLYRVSKIASFHTKHASHWI